MYDVLIEYIGGEEATSARIHKIADGIPGIRIESIRKVEGYPRLFLVRVADYLSGDYTLFVQAIQDNGVCRVIMRVSDSEST